jgi:hypothetical protein
MTLGSPFLDGVKRQASRFTLRQMLVFPIGFFVWMLIEIVKGC